MSYVHLFDKFRVQDAPETPTGFWTNFLGIVTDCSIFPHADALSGQFLSEPPIPDDKVYGTCNEYAAVLEAVDKGRELGRHTFAMVELGAGWGPWISGAGIASLRAGYGRIQLVGVEADQGKYDAMTKHFARNKLMPEDGIEARLIHGAAWSEDTTLKFPKIGLHDHGAAASTDNVEYRGKSLEMIEVPAFSLLSIAGHIDIIDVMHWDVQGAEARIASASRRFINSRVRSLQIGTHSRALEGELLSLFFEMGWELIRQTPCSMNWDTRANSLEGMTISDGELYLRNPALWNAA